MSDVKQELQTAVDKHGIGRYQRHIFLCTGPSCCTPETGQAAWEALKQSLKDNGLTTGRNACYRTKVGCLRICCHGPTMVVYPEGTWYSGMTADHMERFVREPLIDARPIREWLFAEKPLAEK